MKIENSSRLSTCDTKYFNTKQFKEGIRRLPSGLKKVDFKKMPFDIGSDNTSDQEKLKSNSLPYVQGILQEKSKTDDIDLWKTYLDIYLFGSSKKSQEQPNYKGDRVARLENTKKRMVNGIPTYRGGRVHRFKKANSYSRLQFNVIKPAVFEAA